MWSAPQTTIPLGLCWVTLDTRPVVFSYPFIGEVDRPLDDIRGVLAGLLMEWTAGGKVTGRRIGSPVMFRNLEWDKLYKFLNFFFNAVSWPSGSPDSTSCVPECGFESQSWHSIVSFSKIFHYNGRLWMVFFTVLVRPTCTCAILIIEAPKKEH